jgi:hypothetical protein
VKTPLPDKSAAASVVNAVRACLHNISAL